MTIWCRKILQVLEMNIIPDSVGESSSKRQENGDASTGSERPLKKARFAWQVKGKYHLRNETNDSNKTTAVLTNESDGAGSSSESITNSHALVGNTEQNLEILGDYLLKQDFNTLDSVITDPDKSLLTPSANLNTETLQYPRYISSYDNLPNNSNTAFISYTKSNENLSIPPSMVASNSYNEDQCIARWQARQMAKGFVDNTINRVLDSWMHPLLPQEMDNSRFLALDVAEFINNLPGDNSIENEGILMAISAHGLQNTSTSSSSNSQNEPLFNSNSKDAFLSPPCSPMQSDDEMVPEKTNSNKLVSDRTSDDSWLCTGDTKKDDDDLIPFSFFPDSNSYQYFNDTGNIQSDTVDYDGDENSIGNHYDFMDAAVSFAIQNKGLTTFGTDYG